MEDNKNLKDNKNKVEKAAGVSTVAANSVKTVYYLVRSWFLFSE